MQAVLDEVSLSSTLLPLKTVMIRSDAQVHSVETNIDTLAEQLAELSIIVNKSTERGHGKGLFLLQGVRTFC